MTLFKNHTMNHGHKVSLFKLHCVIHEESLCARTKNRVINIVVNLILFNKLYHKQFRQILVEAESQYCDPFLKLVS